MLRTACPIALVACIGLVPLLADDNAPVVFRSDVSLVRVDAQVLDRDNRAITGLRAEDFVLREDGRVQPIRNFASENMPIDVLFLLDVSASMRPHVQRIDDAARQALNVLRDNDRMGIMVFDTNTRLRLSFRSDRRAVQRELDNLLNDESFRGGTDITRGMYDAVDYVRREGRRDARRAIIILTDDQTQRNRDEEGVERALAKADTVMSALIAPDAMRSRRMGQQGPSGGGGPVGGGGGLGGIIFGQPRGGYGGRRGGGMNGPNTHSAGTAAIARASGGDSMPVDDSYALEDTLQRIRQRYALYFSLPAGARSGDQRSISLELSDAAHRRYPYADLRYRRDYYVPSGVQPAPGGGEPTVISRAPSSSSDDDRPILRRPAVSQGSSGTYDGPISNPQPAADSTASQTSTSPAAAPAPAAASAPATNSTAPAQSSAPGWRKLKPGEQPQ